MTHPVGALIAALVGFCERRAVLIVALVALLAAVSGAVAYRYAAIDSDLERLIRPSAELPWYQHDIAYKAAFPQLQQTAVVVVSGADRAAVAAAARKLAAAFEAERDFAVVLAPALDPYFDLHRPYYLEPEQLAGWLAAVDYNLPALRRLRDAPQLATVAELLGDHAATAHAIPGVVAALAEGLLDPAGPAPRVEAYPRLAETGDGSDYVLITLRGEQHLDRQLPHEALVGLIRRIIDATPMPDVSVRLTGEVVLANEEIGMALTGIGVAGTLSLLLLAVILGFGVRSWRVILAIFAMLLAGVLITLGFATVTVGTFNTLALMFVVMFFGLGVDFAVHFALRIRERGSGEAERERGGNVTPGQSAALDVGPALALCLLTSSIGFLAFAPTDYRGLAELGIISAGGMAIAFLLTITLIPAVLRLLGVHEDDVAPPAALAAPARLRPGVLVAAVLFLTLGAGWIAKDLRFDYSVLALRDAETEAMSTLLELQATGISTDYSTAVLAADADAARELQRVLSALPEVGAVSAPADLVPDRQAQKQAMLQAAAAGIAEADSAAARETREEMTAAGRDGERLAAALARLRSMAASAAQEAATPEARDRLDTLLPALERLVADAAAAARFEAALARALDAELRELMDRLTAAPVDLAALPEELRSLLITADGRHLLTVDPVAPLTSRAATERFINAIAAVAPNFAGRAVVEWGVGNVVVESFRQAAMLATSAILVLLIVYFRSFVLPLLVLAPLAVALLITFAIAELSGLTLNMANILVVPLIFGLGVDTGIHVVHRFTHAGSVAAVFASSTARAVFISGLTTIGTFVSLSFSPHRGAASVGLLLSIAIGLMLAATFVLLPALLRLMPGLRFRPVPAR
jgi:uncharacterized protein